MCVCVHMPRAVGDVAYFEAEAVEGWALLCGFWEPTLSPVRIKVLVIAGPSPLLTSVVLELQQCLCGAMVVLKLDL